MKLLNIWQGILNTLKRLKTFLWEVIAIGFAMICLTIVSDWLLKTNFGTLVKAQAQLQNLISKDVMLLVSLVVVIIVSRKYIK